MNILLSKLNEVKKYCNEIKITIKSKFLDGRIDSLLSESKVAKKIADKFNFVILKEGNRDFGDFYIKIEERLFPVNIKLTSIDNNSNDNLSGIVNLLKYVLFDNESCGSGHKGLAKKIASGNITDKFNDYGYLCIEKETGLCKVATILTMENYVVNPSNGFQANFNRIKIVDKTLENSHKYIINKYIEYCKKKAEAYLILIKSNQINE